MYTFLPIAPCTFTVNGKHFSLRVNEPFSVELKEAKIIASPSFRFRKYVRLITPLPQESTSEKLEIVEPKSNIIEDAKVINEESINEVNTEFVNEVNVESIKESSELINEATNELTESTEETTSKKRIRRKSSLLE